jgi:hypothetical protein
VFLAGLGNPKKKHMAMGQNPVNLVVNHKFAGIYGCPSGKYGI